MHQEIACAAADIAAGFCSQECDTGDCLPHLMGDDPDSKIYTAKQAIYTIMASHPNINFGFGHFDQTGLQVNWKYWWYSVATVQAGGFITLDSGLQYPEPGQLELFGDQAWNCTDGGGGAPFANVGCGETTPAHLDNSWEWERARRYPKLGDTNTAPAYSYYINESSTKAMPTYKVTFTPVAAQVIGAPTMQVLITVNKCLNSSCSGSGGAKLEGSKQMTFNMANQTVYWDPPVLLNGTNVPDANGNGGAFYGSPFGTAFEVNLLALGNTDGYDYTLDENNDTSLDPWSTTAAGCTANTTTNLCDMQQPTTTDSLNRTPANTFASGNVIPLDWTNNQQAAIIQRVAPNLLNPLNTVPDFGIADYMADHPLSGQIGLQLKNAAQRPLAPEGGTPTGHVLMSFADLLTGSTWYNNPVKNGTSITGSFTAQATSASWIGTASSSTGDPFFACKPAYVLILTDGLASSDDETWSLDKNSCPTYYNWIKPQAVASSSNPPGFACCAVEALRSITYSSSGASQPYPVRTYVIGLGLTSTTVGGYNNTLQCMSDMGGTGNRHFFNGNASTVPGQPAGYPASDPPAAGFCSATNPCDGPGPILPQNKQQVLQALESVLNLIQSQTSSFASAAVPSLQSNVANESILSSFLPVNEPIWPGRLDAYVNPVPVIATAVTLPDGTVTQEPLPNPALACTSAGQQACHLWNAGDQILAQGLNGLDAAGTDPTKRRIYYASAAPIAGQQRFLFQMPALTSTAQLFDLENAMGICGAGYTFYPPTVESCTENSTPVSTICTGTPTGTLVNPCPTQTTATPGVSVTANQAITFTEAIKTYVNSSTNQAVQYLLGDIFHSNPQVLGQPADPVLFSGNVDSYQAFANAEQFRRKVVYFGSNDGELHAVDAGTVALGTSGGQSAWVFGTGTGSEIFAFIPRSVMPSLNNLAIANQPPTSGGKETFMVDGPPTLGEGFFDATGGTNPQWHSLVIGGLREGGRAVYAIDVTQPDTLISKTQPPGPTSLPTIPIQLPNPSPSNYLPNCLNGGAGCGQVPYATPLWEFTDSCQVVSSCSSNCAMQPCDEDASGVGKGQPDLGQTWSTPAAGRVRICDTTACTTFHEQWVVIFGGGMDPAANNSQGNYLYMLDMATGKVIYKRPLNGSVPMAPAAADTGLDGFIDTIYVGTTAGHLYKIDLTQPAPIVAQTGLGNRVSTTFWVPLEIFNTQGRQMFFPPAVFFDPNTNEFGLAWGTGNRQDLWKSDTTTGRMYVMLDTNLTPSTPGLPLTAANLQQITPDGTAATADTLDFPSTGMQPGYYFELAAGERVLSTPFVLSAVLIFNSYQPQAATGGTGSSKVCIDSGNSRVFVLNLTNGNALSSLTGAQGTIAPPNQSGGTSPSNRYFILGNTLALNITSSANPALFPTQSNPNPTNTTTPGSGVTQCDLTSPYVQSILIQVEKLMPSNCRYSNATTSVYISNTAGETFCANALPLCIIEKNWKEF
jgi:hypothetical protein